VIGERAAPAVAVGQTGERRDGAAGNARHRSHARHARLTVDPDRAAATLTLRAATVLRRADPEDVAKDVEQRRAVVTDLDALPVEIERDGQEKL
jgi:hypothetical protein